MLVNVIHEDNHLLVVNKPPGVLVQGDATGDKTLGDWCKDYIAAKYNKKGAAYLGVIHRLDRPVSGLVVFARTSKALARMNAMFRSREVSKHYSALTDRRPPAVRGEIVSWLSKNTVRNKVTVFPRETEGAQKSALRYHVVSNHGAHWLLDVEPLTGRSHQIRAQLASLGCPICGDVKYGSTTAGDGKRIYLHATRLDFDHPVGKERLQLLAWPKGQLWTAFLKDVKRSAFDEENPGQA